MILPPLVFPAVTLKNVYELNRKTYLKWSFMELPLPTEIGVDLGDVVLSWFGEVQVEPSKLRPDTE